MPRITKEELKGRSDVMLQHAKDSGCGIDGHKYICDAFSEWISYWTNGAPDDIADKVVSKMSEMGAPVKPTYKIQRKNGSEIYIPKDAVHTWTFRGTILVMIAMVLLSVLLAAGKINIMYGELKVISKPMRGATNNVAVLR
jgi:hypothetical protein